MSGHAVSFGIRPGYRDGKRGVIGRGTGKIKDLAAFLDWKRPFFFTSLVCARTLFSATAGAFALDRLCHFPGRRGDPVRQRHQLLDQPSSGGTRRRIDLVYGLHSVFSTTPVGKVQPYQPSSFDIGANDRFRHSAPSDAGEKKLVPRCLIADAPGIESRDQGAAPKGRPVVGKCVSQTRRGLGSAFLKS